MEDDMIEPFGQAIPLVAARSTSLDRHRHHGPLSIRSALDVAINLAAVS
jgi:hypothetical protein